VANEELEGMMLVREPGEGRVTLKMLQTTVLMDLESV